MKELYLKFLGISSILAFIVSVSCMHGSHMMGMMGNQHQSETTIKKKELQAANFDDISIVVNGVPYPFYINQPNELEIFVTDSRTYEPVKGVEVKIQTIKLDKVKSKDISSDYPSRMIVTDKNGTSRLNYLFPEAGKYRFNLLISTSNKSYTINVIEDIQNPSNAKHESSLFNNKWLFGLIGSSAMILLMVLFMDGIDHAH